MPVRCPSSAVRGIAVGLRSPVVAASFAGIWHYTGVGTGPVSTVYHAETTPCPAAR